MPGVIGMRRSFSVEDYETAAMWSLIICLASLLFLLYLEVQSDREHQQATTKPIIVIVKPAAGFDVVTTDKP
jgi:hypothetical protein